MSYKQGQRGIVEMNPETFKAEPDKQVGLCRQGQGMNAVDMVITSGVKEWPSTHR